MAFLIGTDEAGYGPNLGPLVVTATVWELPDSLLDSELYHVLKGSVTSKVPAKNDDRVWIADSKLLYKPGGGLARLERGVLAALATIHAHRPKTWQQLLDRVDPAAAGHSQKLPWYQQFDELLPAHVAPAQLSNATNRLGDGLSECGVRLHAIRSTFVCSDRFNQLLESSGNKSHALSAVTLKLVADLMRELPGPILVRCDKHGGRNRYGSLLQHWFPDDLMIVRHEGREESRYDTGPADRRVEFRFTAKGDRHLPAALASMVSKYLREFAMRAFNAFWCGHLSELKPTAGYPLDAKRFKRDIQDVQSKLGISDQVLWRAK